MPRSTASFSVAPLGRNGNRNQSALVDLQTAFSRAIPVNDGSIYEPVAPATAEPEIELIEEVGPQGLLSFPVPPCAYHLRVELSDGTEWFISFNGRLVEDTDGERCFLEARLSDLHLDGMPSDPDEIERVLAPQGVEVLEEWLLGGREA